MAAIADLDQVVMGLRQARTVVRAKMVAMEIPQADLVDLEAMEARMGTLDQETMEDLRVAPVQEARTGTLVQEAMEDRMNNLDQEIMEARTATPVQETTEARTKTQAPTMAPASQAPANRTKAVSSHKLTCTQLS